MPALGRKGGITVSKRTHWLSTPRKCGRCGHVCWWVWSEQTGGRAATGLSPEHASPAEYEWTCPACHVTEPGWEVVSPWEADESVGDEGDSEP